MKNTSSSTSDSADVSGVTKHLQVTNQPPPDAEWWTVDEACRFARTSRPTIYAWINKGQVRSVSLRERGKLRGFRRVSAPSLREFLDRHATGGNDSNK